MYSCVGNQKQAHALETQLTLQWPLYCRYDVGITGGVTSMDNFLLRFFPRVAAQAKSGSSTSTDAYCTYSDQNLQAFTSSLFLAAAFAGLAGSYFTRCAAQLGPQGLACLQEELALVL